MIGICTLAEDKTIDIFMKCLQRWTELNYDESYYIFCGANDLSKANMKKLLTVCQHITFITCDNLETLLQQDKLYSKVIGSGMSIICKIAYIREAVRMQALKFKCRKTATSKVEQIDRFLWIDSDCYPEDTNAYLNLKNNEEYSISSAIVPRKEDGTVIGSYWDKAENATLKYSGVYEIDYCGFGMVTMDRRVMEECGWWNYSAYREFRRFCLEGNFSISFIGEDCWIYYQNQLQGGKNCIDTNVICRHYHADGSYWTYNSVNGEAISDFINVGPDMVEEKESKEVVADKVKQRVEDIIKALVNDNKNNFFSNKHKRDVPEYQIDPNEFIDEGSVSF